MRKKTFIGLAVLFCLCAYPASAQLRLIYNETYVNNEAKWPTGGDSTYNYKIANGHYHLTVNNNSSRWAYYSPSIDPAKYFIVEMKFKTEKTATDFAAGIVWSVKDKSNFLFYWKKNGTVTAYERSNGTYSVKTTAASGVTISDGEYHVMKVKSFSNRCEFYIDDKQVLKTEKLTFRLAGGVGAYLESRGTLSVDHLRVYQERDEINLAKTDFNLTHKENLGSAVNTYYQEVQPIVSHDGKTLYFTRKDAPENTGGKKDDIWVSQKGEDGKFSTAVNLGKPVNNTSNNNVAGFSADGKKMVVFGRYNEDGTRLGDGFCEFSLTPSGWAQPRNLDIDNFYNLNDYQEASYSPDGNVLVLTLERRDTYGDRDVYISLRQADGSWSAPFNAGKDINTFEEEMSPFLAGDNKTLYFASKGHPGYGSVDVFMTRRLDDTWKSWSKPVNMGPVINSADWDAYFTIDAKGETAYMVSTHNSVGRADIFKFSIPRELRPDSVAAAQVLEEVHRQDTTYFTVTETHYDSTSITTYTETVLENTDTAAENELVHEPYKVRVWGKIFDALTQAQLPAVIVVTDLEKNTEIMRKEGDASGYDLELPEGRNYAIYAEYSGYVSERVNFDLTLVAAAHEKRVDVFLKPLQVNQTVEMRSIFFGRDDASLSLESQAEIVHVANLMKKNPKMKIMISGHTSMNHADARFNRKISTERAKSVYDELVRMGIPRKRMKYRGMGHDEPAYDVTSLWENARNRRVEFTILEL